MSATWGGTTVTRLAVLAADPSSTYRIRFQGKKQPEARHSANSCCDEWKCDTACRQSGGREVGFILLEGHEYSSDKNSALKGPGFNIEVVRMGKVQTGMIVTQTSNGASRTAWEQRKPGVCT